MKKELKKQFKRLDKRENKILMKKDSKIYREKIAPVMDKLHRKIPEKLKSTLEMAFYKSFKLVFEKGNYYIEKTYNKDKIKLEHDLNDITVNNDFKRKHIKRIDRKANQSKLINSSLAIMEGGLLGALGIGLPDIPLFISVIIKTIYEVALSYGYDYEKEEEKAFILLIICGAMAKGNRRLDFNGQIDKIGAQIDQNNPVIINLEEQVKVTSEVLSEAMLTAKFIQGIPIIGVVGGVVNYNIIKKIGKYSSIKYKKRYLFKKGQI